MRGIMFASEIKQLNESLVNDPEWHKLNNPNSRWSKDELFCNYHGLGNKQKGVLGEYFTEKYMRDTRGSVVEPPKHSDHDRIIDGYKTEIKFSLAVSDSKKDVIVCDKFMINHVACKKDWDRLIFVGINPDPSWTNVQTKKDTLHSRIRAYYMNKEDFVNHLEKDGTTVFKHQQSGEKAENDDYMCTNFSAFIELDFVKEISEW